MVGTITVSNSTATYAWNTGETTASINVTPTTNTTYTVTATDGNCTATNDVDVTVTPLPTVDLGNDVAICAGDSTLLDAGSGHTNYLWNTGETTQTIYADTAGTYSVTVGNGTPITNNSLSFDGVDDYISGAASSTLDVTSTNLITISAWVNFNSNNSNVNYVFAHTRNTGLNQQYALTINPNNKIYFVADHNSTTALFEQNGGNSGQSALSLNQWNHISMTYDGSAVRLYLNGLLDFENFVTDNFSSTFIGNYNIGQRADGSYKFNGQIENINVWNIALTQSEIQRYMSTTPTGNEAGLVGYWNFNEGSGSTVNDLSGNGNNGTISGATWSTDAPAQFANNCTATDDVLVTVNPLPTIDLGADTTLICAGTSETLDAGTGFTSY